MNTNEININMLRVEDCTGWLYGNMIINGSQFCNTLEVSGNQLQNKTTYFLHSFSMENDPELHIGVNNAIGCRVSEIVCINTYYQKNIEVRFNDNFITVGARINMPNLITRQYIYNLLLRSVIKAEMYNKIIKLNIL